MDRITNKERAAIYALLALETDRLGHEGGPTMRQWLEDIERAARLLHGVYTRQCNGYSDRIYAYPARAEARDAKREAQETDYLRARFANAGLSLYLNSDPRGNPVGILTPKTGRYNTLGGRECGWRL